MLGASRESLTTLRASLDARRVEPGFDAVSGDLLAVVTVLGREKSLRQALADAGQPAGARAGIATSLFSGKISELATTVLADVVSQRWSNADDLVDGLEQLAAQAAFTVAETDGSLDRVEDELFTFGRAVDTSPDLQLALTDPSLPNVHKAQLVRDLVSGQASATTATLVSHVAANLRGRRPAAAVEELAMLPSMTSSPTRATMPPTTSGSTTTLTRT